MDKSKIGTNTQDKGIWAKRMQYKNIKHDADNLLCACTDCRHKKGYTILIPVETAEAHNLPKGILTHGLAANEILFYKYRLITEEIDGYIVFRYAATNYFKDE